MSEGSSSQAEACVTAQPPGQPEVDSDEVECVEIQGPTKGGDIIKKVPEIEIKLESSDEEEEDKSEQSSTCSAPPQIKRSGPYATSMVATVPESGHGEDEGNSLMVRPTRKRKATSEVWEFFCRDPGNICRAICGLCKMSVSRGKLGGNFGTTALKRHLECKHPLEWAHRKSMREQKPGEEGEETCEDEEENPYPNLLTGSLPGPPSAASASQRMFRTQDYTAESSQDPASPKTYEIFDSSDEEDEKGDNIVDKTGKGIGGKRKRMIGIQGPSFSSDTRDLPADGVMEDSQPSILFTIPNYSAVPLGARRRKSISAVWQFFCIDPTNICRAICTLCQTSVSRGKLGGHFGTSALMRHMEGKHPLEWGRGKFTKLNNTNSIEVEDEEDEELDEHMMYPEVPFGHFEPAYQAMYSGMGDGMGQMPVEYNQGGGLIPNNGLSPMALPCFKGNDRPPPSMKIKPIGKYPPNHPKAQSWNRSVTELVCEMALPYAFISSRAFQRFMACADPLYTVPTKSFFSAKAVPQLYRSLCEKIVSELKRSASPYIHVSTNMWSGDLTADYLALTAHWCIMNPDTDQAAERKYAVLCVRPFPKQFSDVSIQQELIGQVNQWLTSAALLPGFFVSNRDFNLVQAIKGASCTYVPCFTHSLNLLIKDFLQNNRYITGMLATARKVCSHFIHSVRARKILGQLQSQNRLPKQCLKLETGPRWTSTFYMLQRLLEQQKSVQAYQAMHKVEMVDVLLTPSHWNLMLSLVDLLLPFEMATREVNSHSSSLSQVLPELRYLHIFLKQIRGHFESKGDANGVVLADSFAFKLSTDYGVNEMFQKEEYVLATLLDPRFKGRIEAILPPDSDIDHWKQILVRKVKEAMSSSNATHASSQVGAAASQFRDGGTSEAEMFSSKYIDMEASGPRWRRNMATPPLIHKEKSLIEHLESVGLLASKSTGASLSTESHSACVMVEKYFQDNKTIGAKDDPLIYWQKRMWLWPALTKLAIMYLTCPPSSVFAERAFKSPQPFMDKQCSSDVMEGMEQLIFLKVNLENFPNYNPPTLIFSDNEAEQSDSDEGL